MVGFYCHIIRCTLYRQGVVQPKQLAVGVHCEWVLPRNAAGLTSILNAEQFF